MSRIIDNESYRNTSLSEKFPNSPVVDASLTDCSNEKRVSLLAMIDTSADITAVKWAKIKELESQLGYPLPLEAIILENGEWFYTYVACLVIGNKRFTSELGIYCPPDDDLFGFEEALIGRDIQKELVITLDGPNETLTIDVP